MPYDIFPAYIFIPRLGRGSGKTYIVMGIIWLVSTVLFEFLLGLLNGESPENMLGSYNLRTGNTWLIVVLFTGFVPWLAAKINKLL